MKLRAALLVPLLAVIVVSAVAAGLYLSDGPAPSQNGAPGAVQVVAAENFWGSFASQLGGARVHVLSIVSDPNADAHEYESTSANAQAIAKANLVIVNGAGYDAWALHLIAADNNPTQTVLNVQQLVGARSDANPHFWYSPYYVNATVRAIYDDLVSIDPAGRQYYTQQYASLNSSVGAYNQRIHAIASDFGGTRVAATEDIFVYLANATGLDLVSPPAFMAAVAGGTDPPVASVAQFQDLLKNKSVSLLVYNQQTVTPLTDSMKSLAAQEGIPIVGITETVQPQDATFQSWMNNQLISLQNALGARAQGQ